MLKRTYKTFCELFPYFVPNVDRYKENRKTGGIDIFLENGVKLNFKINGRTGWELKRID